MKQATQHGVRIQSATIAGAIVFGLLLSLQGAAQRPSLEQMLRASEGAITPLTSRSRFTVTQSISIPRPSHIEGPGDSVSMKLSIAVAADTSRIAYRTSSNIQIYSRDPASYGERSLHTFALSACGTLGLSSVGGFDVYERILNEPAGAIIAPDTEVIGGADTILVNATTKSGVCRLWLDPESSFLPRRVEVTVGPRDIASNDGRRLEDIQHENPNLHVVKRHYVVDEIEIAKIGEHPMVVASMTRLTESYDNGATNVWTARVSLENVDLSPDFSDEEFAPSSIEVNGIPTESLDDLGIGSHEPTVLPTTMERVDDEEDESQRDSGHEAYIAPPSLIVVVDLAVAALLIWFLHRRLPRT